MTMWSDVVLGGSLAGGFALLGVLLQQILSVKADRRRGIQSVQARAFNEEQEALIALAKCARRVQRSLVAIRHHSESLESRADLAESMNDLTVAVVVVRVMIPDETVVLEARAYEELAKKIQNGTADPVGDRLHLTPLLDSMIAFIERSRAQMAV